MRRILACIVVAVAASASLFSSELKDYIAEKTEIAPVIDGHITNDPAWAKAQWQTNFTSLQGNTAPSQKTRFKVLYDNERLYFAIECFEKNIKKLKIKAKEKDGPVYTDDSVELFLVPDKTIPDDPNWRLFYHFIVNAGGTRYDETSLALVNNKEWNCPWKAATKIQHSSWIAEIAIPFYVFEITNETGHTWRFNISRNRKAGKTELSTWSPLQYSFGECQNFSFLKNINVDFEDYLITLSKPDATLLLEGEKVIPGVQFNVINRSRKNLKCEIETQLFSSTGQSYITRRKLDIEKDKSLPVVMGFPDVLQGTYSCITAVNTNGKTVKFNEYPAININPIPFRIKLITPNYRKTIFPGQKLKNIVLEVSIVSTPDKLKDYKLILNLKEKSKDKILQSRKKVSPPANFQVSFDAMSLSPGNYVIETLIYENDKEILKLNQAIKKLKPAPGNEVWIDNEQNLVVNGQKTFIHGFLAAINPDLAKQIKGKGFNLAHTYVAQYKNDEQLLKEILTPASEAGVKAMFYPYYKTKFGFFGFGNKENPQPSLSDSQLAGMIRRVKKFGVHPAILAWYLCDEPRGAEFRRNLKKIYEILKDIDPYHPVIALDCSPTEAVALACSTDIILCDFYPNFDKITGVVTPLVMIYNGIKEVRKSIGDKLPIWFTPQAFDRSDYYKNPEQKPFRAPTYIESRCMNYLALVAGAKAIIYFQFNGKPGILAHPKIKLGIIEGHGSEISDLMPVLLGKTIPGASVNNPAIKTMLKLYKNKYFLLAVNSTRKKIDNVKFKIEGIKDSKIATLFESRQLTASHGEFSDSFKPFEVHVYTNDLNFPQTFNVKEIINKLSGI